MWPYFGIELIASRYPVLPTHADGPGGHNTKAVARFRSRLVAAVVVSFMVACV